MQQRQPPGQRPQRVKDARIDDVRCEYMAVLAHYGSIPVQDLVLKTDGEEVDLNASQILHKVVDTRVRHPKPLFSRVRQFISLNHSPVQFFSRNTTKTAQRRASM